MEIDLIEKSLVSLMAQSLKRTSDDLKIIELVSTQSRVLEGLLTRIKYLEERMDLWSLTK